MKSLLQLILTGILMICFATGVQAMKENPDAQSETLLQAIRDISERYNVHFTYDREIVENVKIKEYKPDTYENVDEALKSVLKGTKLKYVILEMKYVIIYQDDEEGMKSLEQMVEVLKKIIEQKKEKRSVSVLDRLQSSTDLSSIHLAKHRMVLNVSGAVTDQAGEPLIGVNVLVKGTNKGTATDFGGRFTLEDVNENATLVFSYVGYRTEEFVLNGLSNINITMIEDSQTLDEVVVVGYGTKKRENLTSAVQTVDKNDFQDRPVKSLTEMLSASVPNLNIKMPTGAPDAEPRINIRGYTGFNQTGAPLILVDNVPMDIKMVNPHDVESISVLKDAAASAIYGSRAPNGVLLITTKSGKRGQPMTINASTNVNIAQPIGLHKALNGYEHAIDKNNRRYNTLQAPRYSETTLDLLRQYVDGEIDHVNEILPNGKYAGIWETHASEDHFANAFRDYVINYKYNIGINGGSQKTSYFASASYIQNQGTYESDYDWLNKYITTFKVETDVTDWLNTGLQVNFGQQDSESPTMWRNGSNDGTFYQSLAFPSTLPEINDNGSPNEFAIVPNLWGLSGTNRITQKDIWLKYDMAINPLEGLTIKADYARRFKSQFDKRAELIFTVLDNDGSILGSRRSPRSEYVREIGRYINYYIINANVDYTRQIGNHYMLLMAGYNEEYNKFNDVLAQNANLLSHSVWSLKTTTGDSKITNDNIYAWATRGYFFRASYNFNQKYLIDFNGRYDASSKFSPETRWAFFPSVSVGYNIAKENFWTIENIINSLKVRSSWGILGNNSGSNYSYLPTIGIQTRTGVIIGDSRPGAITQPPILASDLTWTKPRTIGFGVEAEFFNNRLRAEYDWYQRTIFDQQGPAEVVPEMLGTNPPTSNSAVSETRGWELSLYWRDMISGLAGSDLNYRIRVGVSDYIGYVVEYSDNDLGLRRLWTPGQIFGEVYGYESLGIAENPEALLTNELRRNNWYYPGDLLFKDTNGDGLVNSGEGGYWYAQGDRKRLGFSYPRYKYNINLTADWKNFSFSMLFDGVGHQRKYIGNRMVVGDLNFTSQSMYDLGGYWSYENTDAFFPRGYYSVGQKDLAVANDQYVSNLAHLRIKNLFLSYQLPQSIISNAQFRNLSVNISIENLGMVFYENWDKARDPLHLEYNAQNYPPVRTFSLGLKLTI